MKAYHCLVTGSSGGGKTTWLRQMHATTKAASVFMTAKKRESNVAGTPVNSRRGLNTAVRRASRGSDVRCKWFGASYPQDAETVREWAHDVHEHRDWPVQIIVDECQNDPGMDGSTSETGGAIRKGLHEDRDMAIKWVVCTQDPQDLDYPPLKQCRTFVWCGPAKTWHKGFLVYYNLEELDLPQREYQVAEIDPSLPPEVVWRGETNPTYA